VRGTHRGTRTVNLLGLLLAVALGTACSGNGAAAIKSALPSTSARPTISISPIVPSGGGGGSTQTPAVPPTQAPQSPGTITVVSGEQSDAEGNAWAWVLLAVVVIVAIVAVVARSSGRRGAERSDWRTRALQVYAEGASLMDALSLETSGPAPARQDEWVRRWSEIDRRADAFSTALHGVESGSRDSQTTQAIGDLGSATTVLRSSIRARAEAGPGGQPGPLADRVQEFERCLQVYRARLG